MNLTKLQPYMWYIGMLLIVVFLWLWSLYNSLVRKRNQVKMNLSNINIQIGRKMALVDRLVGLVREYTKHESETFEKVAEARSSVDTSTQAKDAGKSAKAEQVLSDTLKSLFAVVESYPKLQANQNFSELQDDLKDIENMIAQYREEYNYSVQKYNNTVQTFPNMIFSSLLGFKDEPLFEIEPEQAN